MSNVRVKRKGQVTIPVELRSRLGIEEGTLLEVKEQSGAILMRPAPRLKGGKVVGHKEYKRLIHELDELRRNWH
ncbi:MAG: AbrB/MazE/SpoVT family DNA-binding domain-containing protein [archaeon]|nr:AbrB/MazE/SpoVT family DNA-binding domain-containing protein [archaeon]